MKSRSFANRALEMAMRSMIGATCSAKESGWDSHNHSLALNLQNTSQGETRRPGTLVSFFSYGALYFNTIKHPAFFDPITKNRKLASRNIATINSSRILTKSYTGKKAVQAPSEVGVTFGS